MSKKLRAIFCIGIGISMMGMWTVLLSTNNVPEIETEPVSISFHLFAEFSTAFLLLASGFGILTNKKWADELSLLSMGALMYAVVNAAGYYGNLGDTAMVVMFAVIFIAAVVFTCLRFKKEKKLP